MLLYELCPSIRPPLQWLVLSSNCLSSHTQARRETDSPCVRNLFHSVQCNLCRRGSRKLLESPPGLTLDELGMAPTPTRPDGTVVDWTSGIRGAWDISEAGALRQMAVFLDAGEPDQAYSVCSGGWRSGALCL